jgi:hypothetical protein
MARRPRTRKLISVTQARLRQHRQHLSRDPRYRQALLIGVAHSIRTRSVGRGLRTLIDLALDLDRITKEP